MRLKTIIYNVWHATPSRSVFTEGENAKWNKSNIPIHDADLQKFAQ
jgi:hypothetical protein